MRGNSLDLTLLHVHWMLAITFETTGLIVEKCLKVETPTCNWDYDCYDL